MIRSRYHASFVPRDCTRHFHIAPVLFSYLASRKISILKFSFKPYLKKKMGEVVRLRYRVVALVFDDVVYGQ